MIKHHTKMMMRSEHSCMCLSKKYKNVWKSWMVRIYCWSWQRFPNDCFGKIYVGMYEYTYMCRYISPQHAHAPRPQLGKPKQQLSFSLEENLKNLCSWHKSCPALYVILFLIFHLKKSDSYFPPSTDGINILGLHQTRKPSQ